MSISGNNGVLHTNSSYFSGSYLKGSEERQDYFLQSKLNADLSAAKAYAESQEKKFYQMFFSGVQTFNGFIAEMRKIFSGAEKDGQRIKQLANANFSNILGTGDTTEVIEELEYKIIVEGDSAEIPLKLLENNFITVEGGPKFINIDTDVFNAKEVLEYIRKDPKVKPLLKTKAGHYKKNGSYSSAKKNIKQWFHNEMETAADDIIKAGKTVLKELGNSGVFIEISNKAEEKTTTASGLIQIAKEFPLFSLNPSEIRERLNDPKQKSKTIKEMGQIIERLKAYIFNNVLNVNSGCVINGTNVLKEAATIAWRNNLSIKLKGDPTFFFVGGNFTEGLKGQLGEFQLDVLTQYTLIATGKTNPTLGHIIGGIVDGSRQQPRSDYQIIVELGGDVGNQLMGIQVKNYKESQMRKVEIKSDLGLIAPNLGVGFVDTITNTQFNADITQKATDIESFLTKFLNKYFWKAMNLNISEDLNPTHTNTFYWMGGTAIVPASTIIDTLYNTNAISTPTFSISGFQKPITNNVGFKQEEPPLFTEYWHGNQYIGWETTGLNISTYDELLSGIRVSTKFNMLAILRANGGIGNFEFF